MSNFGHPLQIQCFLSSALLYCAATAGLSAQPALQTSQHRCITKQIEFSSATTSLSVQLQRLSTKGGDFAAGTHGTISISPRNTSVHRSLVDNRGQVDICKGPSELRTLPDRLLEPLFRSETDQLHWSANVRPTIFCKWLI